jgi:drug/metabolite transporter (DMT)-like permease
MCSMSSQDDPGRLGRQTRSNAVIPLAFACSVASGTAVNFLIGFIAKTPATLPGRWGRIEAVIQAVALNGERTVIAAGLLCLPVLWYGVNLRFSFAELWRYILLAALTMAIPHALIFSGMGVFGSTATNVAFIESAVLGLVVVYLFAGGRGIGVVSLVLAVLSLAGLAILLGVGPIISPVGDGLVLASAFVTAFGMILSEKLNVRVYAPESLAAGAEGRPFVIKAKWSLRKTFVSCVIAGSGTLMAVAAVNWTLRMPGPAVSLPSPGAWPWIIALALVGNCVFWFSFFLLIELKKLILAAAAVAAMPVATELTNQLFFKPVIITPLQWVGAVIVIVSLAALIAINVREEE